MDCRTYFNGKKVTVMGLGLLGRGVGDAKYLAEQGAELIVTDLKTEEELKDSVEQLKGFENIIFVLGEHRLEDFRDKDFILKAAGVPLDSVYIEEAHKNNVPVEMSASLFAKVSKTPIIGVTGTRGKSTVTHLIHEILKEGGKEVLLGGNVRGVSTLTLLNDVTENAVALFELDSWQLQGFGESELSPHISVFTNFLSDHMNYYKGDMDQYFLDKANIFLYQKEEDHLVIDENLTTMISEESTLGKLHITKAGSFESKLKGEHNQKNIALAVEVAKILGIEEKVIQKAVSKFNGVSGRLEFLREVDGVSYYNDTTATTKDATIAALKAFPKKVVLIMGGADKELSVDELLEELLAKTKAVVLLKGTGTEKIKERVGVLNTEASSMAEAVKKAKEYAEEGDVVLLSPAFASFGMFKNEFDRGDQFVEAVESL